VPKVSVIVPCYNQGQFLDDAVNSVLSQTYSDFEIIVVNDGSTEQDTIRVLETYNKPKTRVIHTANQGLAAARNNGIREARGVYILPLDADDKICPTYMEKAVRALDDEKNVGIVYCEANFFGDKTGKWELPPCEFPSILMCNVIFSAAFFRRSDWAAVGGYNPAMLYGWEDYDLWLSLLELGRDVRQIPETLFHYRTRSGSMVKTMQPEHYVYSFVQLFKNHRDLYEDNIQSFFEHFLQLTAQSDYLHGETLRLRNEVAKLRSEIFNSLSQVKSEQFTESLRMEVVRLQNELSTELERSQLRVEVIVRLQGELSASRAAAQQAAYLNEPLKARLDESETIIRARDVRIASLQDELAALVKANELLSSELSMKVRELDLITRSLGWRLLRCYGSLKYRYLLPVYRLLGLWPYGQTVRTDNRGTESTPPR
jgi:glycosyltransferase involved in cell wall biosynthesis